MVLTKDSNSVNEISGIKASYSSSQISNIFDDANNYSASNLTGVNTFRASDRTTYTPGGINTPQNEYVVKSNNSNKSDSQEFALAALQPDLIVRNVSNPTSAAAGSTIQVNYEILNQGSGSADYSYTKFYLSKDLTLGNSDDVFLNYDYVTSLFSNYYSQESTTLTISDSVAAGTYYLVYEADGYNYVAESNESNNAIASTINITKPDLILQNAVAPSSASVGSTISVSYQVKNQGNANAGYSFTNFYLSQDLTLDSNDKYIGYDYVADIGAGISRSESTTLTIDSTINVGNYYLIYHGDGDGNVSESNENNNLIAKAIAINPAGKPDLIVQNASAPSSASVSSTIQLSYQVKNQGVGSAIASTTKFYLSKDNVYSTDDVLLGSDAVNSIAAGATSSETASLAIANTIATGNYYLLYRADADSKIAETNESNNVVSKAITITKADLIIQNAVAPSSASVSSTIQLSYQVKNQGVGSAIASTTKFYLSKDNVYSTDDVLLGSDAVNSIAAGATSSETASLAIANTIATGNYYLLYRADADNKIAESNETNNVVSKAITITKADLIIQNAVAPSSVSVGGTINISYQVKNQGVGSAIASTTRFYLSKDNVYSTDDVLLGSDAVNTIAAGATSSETASLAIANTIAAGNYYLLYRADADNKIAESNETNNVVSKAIAINGPKPDLIIQNVSVPSLVDPGSLITLNYQLANQGTATAGTSTTKFYLSKDAALSNDDTLLGSGQNYLYNGLKPGYYSSESYYVSISSSTTNGNYYLLFKADANNELTETNENNNVTAKAITITAPDLVIQNASAPASASIGTTIQVSYQVKNQGNGTAGVFSTSFYLSKDQSLSNDDAYLGSDLINNFDLTPGSVSSESTSFSLPRKPAVGNYYLLYKADGFNMERESNENNNLVAKAITITAPDLVIVNTSAPTSAAIGTKLEFTYEIKNQGNGNAGTSKTGYSLSRDTILGNDDDISIGYDSVAIPSLAPSATFSKSISWTIDTIIAPGQYYLMFTADGLGNVAESNESNNSVYNTQAITLTPANGGGFNSTTGYGLINAAAAVAKALGQTTFADVPDLGGDNWGADAIKAPEVWAKGYTGQGVLVAVVDSGVDYNHPDLSANIWKNSKEIAGNGKDDDGNGYIDDVYGWNFIHNNNNTLDGNGHGTHVAGTIAAVKNSFGVTGIAYNAKIMPVRVFDDDGKSNGTAIPHGIRYAADNGAKVINLSLKSTARSDLQSAIQYAVSKGAIVVSAAGNDSELEPAHPARYADKWGIAVGAVNYDRTLADFSNRAGTTTLAYVTAPGAYEDYFGIGIYSTVPGNKYDFKSGTSMAAPHVAGVVALMLSAKKGLTDAQVRQILTTTSGNGVKSSSASLNINSISDSNAKLSSLSLSSTNRINSVISSYPTERKVAISNWSPSSNKQSEIANFENPDKFADKLFWENSVKFYDSQDGGENSLAEYDWEQLWD
ncbi:MAG: S8 family serine peptidase [Desmonostoc geniculatum HA4340-LM1]|jgi:subtilase family serine protease/subtilisin family serine protease|nr:S8 family serine peptidase [Desmonostoc geniculatum HA4340-LM1]